MTAIVYQQQANSQQYITAGLAWLCIDKLSAVLQLPKSILLDLTRRGKISPVLGDEHSGWYFHPKTPEFFNRQFCGEKVNVQTQSSSCSEREAKVEPIVKSNFLIQPAEERGAVKHEPTHIDANSRAPNSEVTIEQVCNFELIKELTESKKARSALKVAFKRFNGLKLECSKFGRKLVVKTKKIRCVLHEWSNLDDIQPALLEKHIERYEHVFTQLKRRPETQEYKLYSQQLKTVSDVIYNHLNFNVFDKHGEGSDEHKLIESLIRNHLSRSVEVTLPSKRKEVINLMDELFCSFTVARFNAYLETFRTTNGVHDKIISRVKAAFNFALDEKLISATDIRPFVLARRIDRERHVEISDEHMKQMFDYLDDHVCADFIFFMNLQSSGHFRDGQVMSLRFSDFDFANCFVRVKPKQGKEVIIHLPRDVVSLVAKRKEQFKARELHADYIFPSRQSKTGHRANFDGYWYEMLKELGFCTEGSDGKMIYQYRLHDFRETLLGRLQEFDEYTLAAVLGHLSTNAVKKYKKANTARNKLAAEKGHERKILKVY